jgi:Kef-type K+ transport system membrane component KefB
VRFVLQIEELLIAIAVGLISARFLGEVFERFKLPSVVGQIIAGLIFGPTLLHFIQPTTLAGFAQIGIIFLLFIIGLEIDFKEMKKISNKAIIITGFDVTIAFIFGLIGGFIFGFSTVNQFTPVFIGLAFMATSVGITAWTLLDLDKLNTIEGRAILNVAIYDDIIALIALTVTSAAIGAPSVGGLDPIFNLILVPIFLLSMVFIVPYLAKVLPRLLRKAYGREIILSVSIGLILIFAVLSEMVGLAAILGAFLAGIAFGNIPEIRREIHNKLDIITQGLFLPIFFFQIGVLTYIGPTIIGITTIGLVSLALIGKFIGPFIGSKILKFTNKQSTVLGVGMMPRAEVLLAITLIALNLGIFTSDIYDIIVIIVLISTLMTPILLRLIYRKEIVEESKNKSVNNKDTPS